jgi:hypothetical protein
MTDKMEKSTAEHYNTPTEGSLSHVDDALHEKVLYNELPPKLFLRNADLRDRVLYLIPLIYRAALVS